MLQERERERSDKDSVIANLRLLLEANEEERHKIQVQLSALYDSQSGGGVLSAIGWGR